MKSIFLVVLVVLVQTASFSQEKKLYNPAADAEKDIAAAVNTAQQEHKFILMQAGGNWCSWCIEFARFATADAQIDSLLKKSFVWYHLNMSKENKNEKLFARYGYPQRFGYPVFIVLNEKGERIHTQSSEYLEDGKKTYDKTKVLDFLTKWTPEALDSTTYNQK